MKVQVVNQSNNNLPEYANEGDAGMDLRASFKNINDKFFYGAMLEKGKLYIEKGGRCLVPTDLFVAIPEGYELQIRPRSGLALKQGVTVLNTPGTIDSGYRGNIGVIVMNNGRATVMIEEGDRIAQAVLNKHEKIEWEQVESLDDTERSTGGFGHSGTK
jgi:dUTP pyrophosphatase